MIGSDDHEKILGSAGGLAEFDRSMDKKGISIFKALIKASQD